MLHLLYTVASICFESCEKGSLNKAALSFPDCPLAPRQIIPLQFSRCQQVKTTLKCLDRPCVTFVFLSGCVCSLTRAHPLSSEPTGQDSRVVDVWIIVHIHYGFFWGWSGFWGFSWPLHRFPWCVLQLQGHRGVIYGRCHMDIGVNAAQAPPVLVWTLHHESSRPGRHSEGIRGLQDHRGMIYLKWTFGASCRLNLVAGNE